MSFHLFSSFLFLVTLKVVGVRLTFCVQVHLLRFLTSDYGRDAVDSMGEGRGGAGGEL